MQREFADYKGKTEEKLDLLVNNLAHIFPCNMQEKIPKITKNNNDSNSTKTS
jgi:hypothetical protein